MFVNIESPTEWLDDRACLGLNPDVFYPVRGQSTAPAKDICFTCPVRVQCAEYSIALGEKLGVWGGLSERERRRIRRVRSLARRNGLVGSVESDELDEESEDDE